MVLDGVLGDVELFGDVVVVVALGDELEDFHLALGEGAGSEFRGFSSARLTMWRNSFRSLEAIDGEISDWPWLTERIALATSSIGSP